MEEKRIPYNMEAEQAVLGAIFIDERVYNDISVNLETEDFYYNRHKLIYEAMTELYKSEVNIDFTTLTDILDKKDQLKDAGGLDYLFELSQMVPTAANVDHYIKIVRDKAVSRKLIDTCNNIISEIYDQKLSIDDMIDNAERNVLNVTKFRRTTEFKPLYDVVEQVVTNIEENRMHKGELTGLKTGYYDLDKMTLGLQKNDLIIIAARPSMGKSALAMNIATQVAKNNDNVGVAVFSLEMSAEQLVTRMLSAESSIDNSVIRSGKFHETDWDKILVSKTSLQKLNIYFDDKPGLKVAEVRAKCRKLASEGNLDLVLIDYLQLLYGSDSYKGNRQQEVSEISRSLKDLARELEIPVVALSQLSRNVENRTEKIPIMADLRESGSIEQDADIVMFLYRDDYYNKDSKFKNVVDIIFAKNRHGSVGDFRLLFTREISLFRNLSSHYSKYQGDIEKKETQIEGNEESNIPDFEN